MEHEIKVPKKVDADRPVITVNPFSSDISLGVRYRQADDEGNLASAVAILNVKKAKQVRDALTAAIFELESAEDAEA